MRSPVRRSAAAVLALTFAVPPQAAQVAWGQEKPASVEPVLDLEVLDALDVEPTTGALMLSREDLTLGEGPGAFAVRRTWKPWAGDRLGFGSHWASTLDMHLDVAPDGRHASFVDAEGERVFFAPVAGDPPGVLRSQTGRAATLEPLPQGAGWRLKGMEDETRYAFDREGWLRLRESQGVTVRFRYDAERRLSEVQGPWGSLRCLRDASGALSALEAPGLKVVYEHDAQGQLTTVRQADRLERYGYDAFGRLSDLAEGRAQVLYDAIGRVLALRGPAIHPVRLAYQQTDRPEEHRLTQVTREGRTLAVTVSLDGRRIARELPTGGQAVTWLNERDLPVRFETPDGRSWEMRYDARGRLTERSGPDGAARFAYGPTCDRPTRLELQDGRQVALSYDGEGRLLSLQAPGGGVTRWAYDPAGRLVSVRDPRGAVTRLTWDPRGLLVGVDEDGVGSTRFRRDAAGRVEAVRLPTGRVLHLEHDARGRTTRVFDALGEVLRMEFDARGQLVQRRDELGVTTRYEYNASGDVVAVKDELGLLLGLDYDPDGQVAALVDGAGNKVEVSRPDPRTMILRDPTQGTRKLEFDEAGRLVRETRGQTVLDYTYGPRGELVSRRTPNGVEEFAYDAGGRLTGLKGPAGGFKLDYDAFGRLAALTNTALGRKVEYGYDEAGNRVETRLPWGSIRYDYDVQGRVTRIAPPQGGAIEIGYDAVGRRAQLSYPNGVKTRFAYQGDRLSEIVTRRGDEVVERLAYGYDARGRVEWKDDLRGRTRYIHDARGRLVEAAGPDGVLSYAYDGGDNRVAETRDGQARTLQLAAGNRVAASGERSFRYAATGELDQVTRGDQTTRLVYDHDQHLVQVTQPDGRQVRYGYAPNGSRLWREEGGQRTDYLLDQADVVGEYQGGQLVTSYVHGPELDDVLSVRKGEQDFYYHWDLVRSVTAMTGPDGQVAARYRYDPFGGDLGQEGPAAAWNPVRYTSRGLDPASGLYDFRARSYDPALGRFTSPDPMGLMGGLNLYAYVGNDPTLFNDPYGLKPWWKRWGEAIGNAASHVADAATWVGEKGWAVVKGTGKGLYNVATNPVAFAKGFGKGLWGAAKGIVAAVAHPIDTFNGIMYAIDHPDEIKRSFAAKWDEFTDALQNDPEKFAEMAGVLTAEIAVSVAGTKGLDKLGKVAAASKLGRAAGTVASSAGRVAGRTVTATVSRISPRAATMARRVSRWSSARNATLAARAKELEELGRIARAGRKVTNAARDVRNLGRMAVRSPGSFVVYSGTRMTRAAGALVAGTGRGMWTATKYGGIPVLLALNDEISDAVKRSATHEEAAGRVSRLARDFLRDAERLEGDALRERLDQVGQGYRDYRNYLLKPIHDSQLALDAKLRELNDKVAAGEQLSDAAIDARLKALFEQQALETIQHMKDLYELNGDAAHDMFNPSPNRLVSFLDEIDLLKAAAAKARRAEDRAMIEARIADLEAAMAYENQLYRAGEHQALIAGIAGVPRVQDEPPPGVSLDGLIDPSEGGGVEQQLPESGEQPLDYQPTSPSDWEAPGERQRPADDGATTAPSDWDQPPAGTNDWDTDPLPTPDRGDLAPSGSDGLPVPGRN